MSVNLVVKPVATYASVSDTNGGGFVDGYDATYANFCLSTGAKLDNDDVIAYGDFSYSSSGVYDYTTGLGSGFTALPTGVICRCTLVHDVSGTTMYFHAYLTKDPTGVLNYIETGDSNDADLSTLNTAMQALSATDTLTIRYGGALATIEAGAELGKTLGYNLLEQGAGTYIRTSGITGIVNLNVIGVDSNGDIAYGDARPLEDLHTNDIQYGWRHAAGVATQLLFSSTKHTVRGSTSISSLIKRDDGYVHTCNSDNIEVSSASPTDKSWFDYGASVYTSQPGYHTDGKFYNLYGLAYTGTGRMIGTYIGCMIDVHTVCDGVITAGTGNFHNCIIVCVELYRDGFRYDTSIYSNCIIIAAETATPIAIKHSVSYELNVKIIASVLIGWSKIIDGATPTNSVINCALYNVSELGDDLNEKWQNNIELSANPFINSSNGDYRLDPDGDDFDKLYDTASGRVLIGATGPELTAGGGSGVLTGRIFGGL